jgi:putative copper resistance protein D
MIVCQMNAANRKLALRGALVSVFLLSFLFLQVPHSRMSLNANARDRMSTPANPAVEGESPSKMMADKRESEFNHRMAGLFVIVAGVFMLIQTDLDEQFQWTKYVWPATFLTSGVFLLVWSDTELWPFGHRRWIEALRNNREVLQHKTYAVLLLALGILEWLRTSGTLRAAWSRWVFPVTAVVGSVLLLFHKHGGGMHGPNHMVVMERIRNEHLSFAAVGFAIGLTNAFAGKKGTWRGAFARIWPVLMLVLGALLLFYRE